MSIFNETYKTCCINIDDISEYDKLKLVMEMTATFTPLVAERSTGYFLKLYDGMLTQKPFIDCTNKFKLIIKCALEEGFKCIEIDCDASEVGGNHPVNRWSNSHENFR